MTHNISAVNDDLDDLKDDIQRTLTRKVRRAMRLVEADARMYIMRDSNWRGRLASSLELDVTTTGDGETRITVSAGGPRAPYAPFVEFGTGSRTEQLWAGSTGVPFWGGSASASKPTGLPYDAPNMSPGMVANVIDWVETKPTVVPEDGNAAALGYRIAATIAEKGTYAHPFIRPAWFHNELQVKQAARNALRKVVR